MSTQVTLTLSDDALRRAELLAGRSGRAVAEVLAETVELSLRPLGDAPVEPPVGAWTDAEVLAAADAAMDPAEDRRLSELVDRQQADELANGDAADLTALMHVYQDGLLRK